MRAGCIAPHLRQVRMGVASALQYNYCPISGWTDRGYFLFQRF